MSPLLEITSYRRIARLALIFGLALSGVLWAGTEITLPAAPHDRAGQLIRFRLSGTGLNPYVLIGPDGKKLPVQLDKGVASALVPFQRAGQQLRYSVAAGTAPADSVQVETADGALRIRSGGKSVAAYRMEPYQPRPDISPNFLRTGYLHPLYSPKGVIVTDDYPANHAWHHGIWTPWTRSTFRGKLTDFWDPQKGLGRSVFESVDRSWSGPVSGGFVARHRHEVLGPPIVRVLNEQWDVVAYTVSSGELPANVVDLAIEQNAATDDPLTIAEYHYGGFGIRGSAEWDQRTAFHLLTSEGETDPDKGNHTRVRWCLMAGTGKSGPAGIAVLSHPQNFRFPQPVRLTPVFPYFSFAPQKLGAFEISRAEPYRARYRFIAFDGEPNQKLIDAYWHGYAQTAEPRVETR